MLLAIVTVLGWTSVATAFLAQVYCGLKARNQERLLRAFHDDGIG